ncbi:MAG: hypothetical protein EBY50_09880 [Rhodobacteraceae bacterium]|nr:hypothetical protein [Paracoccaceae bacterium]
MSNLNSAQNARGAWLMIGGMAMIGFVDNFIGPMAEVIGLWQFQIQRSIIAVPTLILLSVYCNTRLLQPRNPKRDVSRPL